VFRLATNGFIFHCQSDADQKRCLALPRGAQDGGRRATGAAHPGDNGIRIQHNSHITYNITSRGILRFVLANCAARTRGTERKTRGHSGAAGHGKRLVREIRCDNPATPLGEHLASQATWSASTRASSPSRASERIAEHFGELLAAAERLNYHGSR
jgi:hypothetical protein